MEGYEVIDFSKFPDGKRDQSWTSTDHKSFIPDFLNALELSASNAGLHNSVMPESVSYENTGLQQAFTPVAIDWPQGYMPRESPLSASNTGPHNSVVPESISYENASPQQAFTPVAIDSYNWPQESQEYIPRESPHV